MLTQYMAALDGLGDGCDGCGSGPGTFGSTRRARRPEPSACFGLAAGGRAGVAGRGVCADVLAGCDAGREGVPGAGSEGVDTGFSSDCEEAAVGAGDCRCSGVDGRVRGFTCA
ncbi:MAG: hypothetical protein J7M24_04095 [Candidatus Latescibacteria bacterium]|nr:hypothetical protein [Candidatus Latescibacterota bacterium]